MTVYYPTHILRILLRRGLLIDRLKFIFGVDAGEVERFIMAVYAHGQPVPDRAVSAHLPTLVENGYLNVDGPSSRGRCSFMNTVGVNFELTYRCNLRCRHCLQQNIRDDTRRELSTEQVKHLIRQVYLSGLCTVGINFTGGEALGHRDDLFEIMAYTGRLGIPWRLNTNSWWAGKADLELFGRHFPSSQDLVLYLKDLGLQRFALSFDERMVDSKRVNDLLCSISLCEMNDIDYEVIFTGIESAEASRVITLIKKALKCNFLPHLTIVYNEMVDVGGAIDSAGRHSWQSNLSPCMGTGFYHPAYLHISPEGKVRTCMYASDAANVGDVRKDDFIDLINRFPGNEIGRFFTSPVKKQQAIARLTAQGAEKYKALIHECARNAFVAGALGSK
ncbi:radical SAM protein [Dehalogenimonas sp. 4OHTPN]|uniref:Radical SAM protein n=1 Tax=Dehalogenimonas sp. 4OHTPN TaxID=3166643 RepID=A0AAU8GD58_9CHLR